MIKNLIITILLTTLVFAVGFVAGSKNGSEKLRKNINQPNKVISSTTRVVSGKVVRVLGKTMVLENAGDTLEVRAGSELFINQSANLGVVEPNRGLVPGSALNQPNLLPKAASQVSDFSLLKVGSLVTATLEQESSGQFLVKNLTVL